MLVSMTAYGSGEVIEEGCRFQVEIKSVNHRFCDVQLRIPREYMALEPRLAALVRETYNRGRVELYLHRLELEPVGHQVVVNRALAREHHAQLVKLQQELQLDGKIELSHLLNLEGILSTIEAARDPDADWPPIREAAIHALKGAHAMRVREGATIEKDLENRLDTLRALHQEMTSHSAKTEDAARERLEHRVREVLTRANAGEIDRGRLLQEVVYLVDRSDITEELVRFDSHLAQMDDLLKSQEPAGRKVDFLLQELLRETNTIGSKAAPAEITRCSTSIKVELEKIREQIQNVE